MNEQERQEEIAKLRNDIDKLKMEIESIKRDKVSNLDWQINLKDFQRQIEILSAKLEEVIKDRKEDRELVNQILNEYKQKIEYIHEMIHASNINNVEISTNQKDVLRRVEKIENTVDKMRVDFNTKMDKMIEATTFNLLEWFGIFMNKNIITKLLTWFFGVVCISLPISGFIYLWTGKSILSLLITIFTN